MRPPGSPAELERRRRRALELLKKGHSHVEVAKAVGADRRSVYRWDEARRAGGMRAIRAKPASGRPPKLNASQKKQLEATLVKGAQESGFSTDLWTCPRIADVVETRFGVRYHVDHVPRLLHQMGWSPQKPSRRAIERDEQAIRTWIKRDWPRIKKKRDE